MQSGMRQKHAYQLERRGAKPTMPYLAVLGSQKERGEKVACSEGEDVMLDKARKNQSLGTRTVRFSSNKRRKSHGKTRNEHVISVDIKEYARYTTSLRHQYKWLL